MASSAPPAVEPFSFNAIAAPDRVWLKRTAASIRVRLRKLQSHRVAVGCMLVRSRRRLGDKGAFGAWVRDELGLPRRQATRLMNVWKTFGKLPPQVTALFDPTAMYTLSEPCASPGVREEFIKRAMAGQFVRGFEVDQMLATARDQSAGDERSIPKDPKPTNDADNFHAAENWFLLRRVLDEGISLHLHSISDEGHRTYHALYHGLATRHRAAAAASLEAIILEVADAKRSKTCTGPCKTAKPLTAFSKRVKNPDGRNDRCADCERKRVKVYEAKKRLKARIEALRAGRVIVEAVAAKLRGMLKSATWQFREDGTLLDNEVSTRIMSFKL